jgi:site-specific recombinase XerD
LARLPSEIADLEWSQVEFGHAAVRWAVNRLIKRIGVRTGSASPVHAHMLRHACGYALANTGHDTRLIQDSLGHRSIQHTTRYTQLSAAPFRDFWR